MMFLNSLNAGWIRTGALALDLIILIALFGAALRASLIFKQKQFDYGMSTALAITFLSFIYLISFGQSLRGLEILTACLAGIGIIQLFLVAYRKPRLFLSLVGLFLAIATVNLYLGKLPLILDDVWAHVTYINRLIEHNSTIIIDPYLPNEFSSLKFAPWHAVMAAIARLTGTSALEIWVAANLVLIPTVFLSYISFCRTAFPQLVESRAKLFLTSLIFLLLFPIVEHFARGSADYRMINLVIFFQALRIAWPWFDVDRSARRSEVLLVFAFLFSMSLVHLIETALFLLAVCPNLLICAWREKSPAKVKLSFALGLAGSLAAAVVLSVLFKGAGFPMRPDNKGDALLLFWFNWRPLFGWPGFVSILGFLWLIKQSYFTRSQRQWLIVTAALATIFGSANPILFPVYRRLMTTELAWRTIFLYPHYLVLGAFACYLSHAPQRWKLIGGIVIVASMAHFLFYSWGLDGTPSYAWSDRYSQLRLYPSLYRHLQSEEKRVIVTDAFTSLPIAAISTNFIAVNRPWSDPVADRYPAFKEALSHPDDSKTTKLFCDYAVDLILVNRNFPENLDRSLRKDAPWVYHEFYAKGLNYDTVFERAGEYDGVILYRFDRSKKCIKGS